MDKKEYIERGAVYVDKQKVKKKLQYIFKTYGVSDVLRNKINKALDVSAADVVEVRHASWKDNHCTGCGWMPMGEELWDHCDFSPPRFEYFMDFCPSCGAKMDGERQ